MKEKGSSVISVADLVYAKRGLQPVRWVLAVPANSKIKNVKDLNKYQRREFKRALKKFFAHGRKNGCKFTIWDVSSGTMTPQEMEAALAGLKYDSIIVDYITLFKKGRMDLWEMQMEYSRFLKGAAKRMNAVIIVLTQLNDNDKVKYGTAVQENLDSWLKWQWREDEEGITNETEVRLALCRHAPTAKFPAYFKFSHSQIQVFPAAKGFSGKNKKGGGKDKVSRENWKRGEF